MMIASASDVGGSILTSVAQRLGVLRGTREAGARPAPRKKPASKKRALRFENLTGSG